MSTVSPDLFPEYFARAFAAMTAEPGKARRFPSSFAMKTAKSVYGAALRATLNLDYPQKKETHSSGMVKIPSPRYHMVSAPTGSGKTMAAVALMGFLYPSTTAFITKTREEAQKVYEQLCKLVPPSAVAIYSSLHRAGADPERVAQAERDIGESFKFTTGFTEAQFKAAPVVVTTHDRWKREHETGKDLGVRCCNGVHRHLIIVDEDPEVERIYVRQPPDVSRLADLFADATLSNDARAYGFSDEHGAAETLRAIHGRMRMMKDKSCELSSLTAGIDLVTPVEIPVLRAIPKDDIGRRIVAREVRRGRLPDGAVMMAEQKELQDTLAFLLAVCDGMAFYSKDAAGSGAFYGYQLSVPAEHGVVILDGTSELNGLYSLSGDTEIVPGPTPNYRDSRLHAVVPPKQFQGRMRPGGIYRNRKAALEYMAWFRSFLLSVTVAGDAVLVYAKKDLLKLEAHILDGEDGSPTKLDIEGRAVHFVHFGRGRGSNDWKDCNVYFRLGDFHLPKAVHLARAGSRSGRVYLPEELLKLNAAASKYPDYLLALESHLLVTTKQDTARVRIRNFDDTGLAEGARLYFVDCDNRLLQRRQQDMFPGSPPLQFIVTDGTAKVVDPSAPRAPRRGDKQAALRALLATTDADTLTSHQIKGDVGIGPDVIDRALRSAVVSPVVAARGWHKSTRKLVGLPGKGYVLTRAA